jgi:hypothetical protein
LRLIGELAVEKQAKLKNPDAAAASVIVAAKPVYCGITPT